MLAKSSSASSLAKGGNVGSVVSAASVFRRHLQRLRADQRSLRRGCIAVHRRLLTRMRARRQAWVAAQSVPRPLAPPVMSSPAFSSQAMLRDGNGGGGSGMLRNMLFSLLNRKEQLARQQHEVALLTEVCQALRVDSPAQLQVRLCYLWQHLVQLRAVSWRLQCVLLVPISKSYNALVRGMPADVLACVFCPGYACIAHTVGVCVQEGGHDPCWRDGQSQ
jgi:hypothetical protein